MNTDNIEVNTQSSIRIKLDKTIYFDPFKIEDERHDADIIFITHAHYDHFDINSINNIKNDNTIIVAPKSMESDLLTFSKKILLDPIEETVIEGISVKTIPSYNIDKQYHPRVNNWLGYIINYNNITYYIAGDTDRTNENEQIKCDIAFIPIGGTYTMDVRDASLLVKAINPTLVIPTYSR